jgi:adenine-specific DNA-methyltransferase
MAELGAARKAVVFTESRRTQAYLLELLENNGYAGRVMTINGTNADDRSGTIYKGWLQRHAGEEIITGNKTVDLRAALVEHFRDQAEILVATEAAAEGVNLQFCSLVVNYDLPWNPQRIEQRIGRCHRYGQKHDVVVINFLNRANAADQRVFDLLSEKFKLFEALFGSSDEVLGALGSGVDFERRIAAIYQSCRTPEEIDQAFNQLRSELEDHIAARMADTRRKLLENFDEDVQRRLKVEGQTILEGLERSLWALTRYELAGRADFHPDDYSFDLKSLEPGWPEVPPGRYQFITRARAAEVQDKHPFRPGHPLAEAIILRAKNQRLPVVRVQFDYSNFKGQIGLVRNLRGRSGWLRLEQFTVRSLEAEDKLLFIGIDDAGQLLHPEACAKLFQVAGHVVGPAQLPAEAAAKLDEHRGHLHTLALHEIGERNQRYFEQEIDKLDPWADDLKEGLERDIKELNAEIAQVDKQAKLAPDLQGKLALQTKKKELEATRKRKQCELFENQDEIEARKERLLAEVEARLKQEVEKAELFTIAWEVK